MKTIIAIGGAGFSKTDLKLEKYILAQCAKENPRILFMPTASGDSVHYISSFYETFNKLPCVPRHLSLFALSSQLPHGVTLTDYMLSHDIIFVGGGNTKNMLALWREWGVDVIMRQAWEKGIVLAGTSAGSLCWFEQGITDSVPHQLSVISGLGFLPGSNCPHYNDEPKRRGAYEGHMHAGRIEAGIAHERQVALHYHGVMLHRVVTSEEGQGAALVALHDGEMNETRIVAELL